MTSASEGPISSGLRLKIASSKLSAYALGKLTGVREQNIRRWLRGESDMMLTSADAIVRVLGLRLAEEPAKKGGRRRAVEQPDVWTVLERDREKTAAAEPLDAGDDQVVPRIPAADPSPLGA